jgi:trimethylamine---corrinoid protein Co-methyltransferase
MPACPILIFSVPVDMLQTPHLTLCSSDALDALHASSLRILERVGVVVEHAAVCQRLAEAGASVDVSSGRVRFPPALVEWALAQAPRQYILHGRDPQRQARFGFGDTNLMSSPGQHAWFDHRIGERRLPLLADVSRAAALADGLPNISIAGGMAVPDDVPAPVRDVAVTAELLRHTTKPTRCFPVDRRSSYYLLEMYALVAGGKDALRRQPMTETLLDPISPLKFPQLGLEIALEFIDYGQPVCVAPMAMAGGSAPATLAGALAQENAEALAGITLIQVLAPGHPVTYGGIPHLMDPRSSVCAFGPPEQGLMAAAICQLAQRYRLPAYINVNLTDAKRLDLQAGYEKMGSLLMGALAGADLVGHAGILGADHGASLAWLAADNEALNYAKRILKGFVIDSEHLAEEVIAAVGPSGNFLAETHTVQHFRKEFWLHGRAWTRQPYDLWSASGESMGDRLADLVDQALARQQPARLDSALDGEIESLLRAAYRELAA